jgi:endonuclease/exonuclease/phosphatase family metal-dependent hydrolase
MRLATFNILHGRTLEDGVVDLERLRAAVREIDADVLAMQEVDCDQPRSDMADLTTVAAEAMGAVSHRFVAALSGTPGATWIAATGQERPGTSGYGIALLSRYPARNWQVLRLPRIPMRFPMYLPGPRRVMVVREEPRAVVVAQLDTPSGPLTVANTHLSFVPGWNRVQLRELRRDLAGYPGPRVVMGDLNMTPPAPERWTGMRPLGSVATFPASHPARQLDHILADDASIAALDCSAPVMPISDHRPLVVDVDGFGSRDSG